MRTVLMGASAKAGLLPLAFEATVECGPFVMLSAEPVCR